MADELDVCKATLCLKEQEIYMLSAEIARKGQDVQTLAAALERLERTTASAVDRLVRSMERLERRVGDRRHR